MSANTSRVSVETFPFRADISVQIKETFFVPTKEMFPVKNTKFCKEYEQQKTWLRGVSCT